MKPHHSKLKNPPRPIFSCAFFRHCTQTTLSPTTPSSPTSHHPPPSLPPAPPPPLQPPTTTTRSTKPSSSSSSSSSSSTSQSFTQWKFPLPTSPIHPNPNLLPTPVSPSVPPPPPLSSARLQEIFHLADLRLSSGSSEFDRLAALHLLERSLLPNPPPDDPACPSELMRHVVSCMRSKLGAKPATKVLFALCLAGNNRQVAVEVGAVSAVVETAMELDGSAAERALAALELMCTVAEGAAEIRSHALAVPVMVAMMAKMEGRGREHAIGVLAVVFGGGSGEIAVVAPPEEVARAVALALQGDCSVRGRRKGARLLKVLQEGSGNGRSDLVQEGGCN